MWVLFFLDLNLLWTIVDVVKNYKFNQTWAIAWKPQRFFSLSFLSSAFRFPNEDPVEVEEDESLMDRVTGPGRRGAGIDSGIFSTSRVLDKNRGPVYAQSFLSLVFPLWLYLIGLLRRSLITSWLMNSANSGQTDACLVTQVCTSLTESVLPLSHLEHLIVRLTPPPAYPMAFLFFRPFFPSLIILYCFGFFVLFLNVLVPPFLHNVLMVVVAFLHCLIYWWLYLHN